MNDKEFIKEAEKFLKYFGKDISGDIIVVHNSDTSVVMRIINNEFHKGFLGHSVLEVAEGYAKVTGKTIKWDE